MKIFIYTPYFLPQSNAAAVRSFWLLRTITNAGHESTVCTSIKTAYSNKMFLTLAKNNQSNLKRLFFEFISGFELFIRIFFSSNELFILSTPPYITVFIAHLACRIKSKPYVLDVRDLYPEVYFAEKLIKERSLTGSIVKHLTKRMYENAFGILSVTPGLIKKIQSYSKKIQNIELLINGYDKEHFSPSLEKFERFTVVFHGNMGKVQNINTILEVAKKLENHTDIEFLFIGEGPQADLLKRSLLKNIKYVGQKKYKEIPQLISKANIGFSARRDDEIGADAFPVKVFEYLGSGLPVIITPCSKELIDICKEGIFCYANNEIDLIVSKILELKNNPIQITITENFSRQEASKKILRFCNF